MCHKAIRRVSAFQNLLELLRQVTADKKNIKELTLIATWVNYWQADAIQMMHYTDGLQGCGTYFEGCL